MAARRRLLAAFAAVCLLVLAQIGDAAATAVDLARFKRMLDPYTGEVSPQFEAWMAANFERYKAKFVMADGRVIDPENGSITHSEGMGYGMLLAAAADDRKTFDRMLTFVTLYMQREDDLVSWVWDPYAKPHVRDPNNATDGDILIAAALYAAAERWRSDYYRRLGERIADAIGRSLIVEYEGHHLLLPGKVGFAHPRSKLWPWGPDRLTVDRSPIINQSYWVFFAQPALKELAPDHPWDLVVGEGLEVLVTNLTFPTDWSVVKPGEGVQPAPGRPAEFAYNAIRIPLYLLAAGIRVASFNQWLLSVWGEPGPGRPFSFAVPGFRRVTNMDDPGYQLIHELVHCTETGEKIDIDLFHFRPTTYFASSLQLITYAAIYAYHPRCVPV